MLLQKSVVQFEAVAKRVQTIEKSASQIGPEFVAFQTQLTSLLAELEERKRAGGGSPAIQDDQIIRKKLEQLQQYAGMTARVRFCYIREGTYWRQWVESQTLGAQFSSGECEVSMKH